MSVTAMAAMASSPPKRQATGETSTERGLRLVAAYIPSEALAAYLALLGLLVPATGTPQNQINAVHWFTFVVGLATVVLVIYLTYTPGTDPRDVAIRKRLQLIGFGVVAFVAYSAATPGGPFQGSIAGIAVTVWGGAAAILLGIFLPLLAGRWGLRQNVADGA